jgi:hypothetical protein
LAKEQTSASNTVNHKGLAMIRIKESLQEKAYLLALGSVVSVFVFLFGMWSDQFITRADYDKDRITNAQVVAKVDSSLTTLKESLTEIKVELKEIRKEMKK